ncbi:hypothetical protein H4K35_10155 [Myroides sp. NP-2]|uniref:hypothetical protein n=1 Tax=Myroides sp. NP-2 TaxID=2759945 RepID=UPI0015FC30CC|nr:hypothetical protein [Myroides sp. NP-2]MBB1150474.1 hypothetical protein [Myroides sp. NP-2]
MRKKKDLPLVILKSLEPYVNLIGEKFEVVDPKDNLLKVIDIDSESSFHFTIVRYQLSNGGTYQFYMERAPKNDKNNGVYGTWLEISELSKQFESWTNILDEYEEVNSFFDDPIVKSFSEEFYTEFEIVDEDADKIPFNTKQILILDNYLNKVDETLSHYITEGNSSDVNDIKEEILLLRENLTKKSKKWVVSKLSKIWAKIAKQGTVFIREFLSESKKELIKQGVKGLIGYVKENGQDLLN